MSLVFQVVQVCIQGDGAHTFLISTVIPCFYKEKEWANNLCLVCVIIHMIYMNIGSPFHL